MSRLTRVIAPRVRAAGLDVHEVQGVGGEVRELLVTNPRFPTWGRVVVDCDGLMEWDYWGNLTDDTGAAQIADVITAIMVSRIGDSTARPTFQPAEPKRDRPRL
jgi:hypothetical protein